MRRRARRTGLLCVTAVALSVFPATGGSEEKSDRSGEERADECAGESEKCEQETEANPDESETASNDGEEAFEEMSANEREQTLKERRNAQRRAMANAEGSNGWLEEYWSWDLKLELGVARQASRYGVKGDMRTGAVYVAEPHGYAFGLVGELSSMSEPAAGVEVEYLSMKFGTFAQLGAMLDVHGRPMATAGVGWQLFALEVQYEPTPDFNRGSSWIGMAKLHFPVSWLVRAFSE